MAVCFAAVPDGGVHAVVALEQEGFEPCSLPFPGLPPFGDLLPAAHLADFAVLL